MKQCRQEVKYVFRSRSRQFVLDSLRRAGFEVQHQSRLVRSIYFDTAWLNFFLDSEEGIQPRKKERYRFFDLCEGFQRGWYRETKLSRGHTREKLRVDNPISEDDLGKIVLNSSGKMLRPKLGVSYRRHYLKSSSLGIRVTLDEEIEFNNLVGATAKATDAVLEMKVPLTHVFADLSDLTGGELFATRSRLSKYCEGIKKLYPTEYLPLLRFD